MRTHTLREVKQLSQGHTAISQGIQDSNSETCTPDTVLLSTALHHMYARMVRLEVTFIFFLLIFKVLYNEYM